MTTRKVKYRGKTYTVPDWVRWIATDLNGSVCGFRVKPVKCELVPAWQSPHKFQLLTLTIADPYQERVSDWKKSAQFVGRNEGKKIAVDEKNLWQDFPR